MRIWKRSLVAALWAGVASAQAPPAPTPAAEQTKGPPGPRGRDPVPKGAPDEVLDSLDPEAALDVATRIRIFRQARRREEEIRVAEGRLKRQQARLGKVQGDLESRFKALRLLQEELAAFVTEENAVPEDEKAARAAREAKAVEEKTKRLSKVFDKMKPTEAAKVIEAMDEALVVTVLQRLRARQAAKILGRVEPDLAARLSEKMARLKRERAHKRRPRAAKKPKATGR